VSHGAGPTVAVVDYGLGNLFSVKLACDKVGLAAEITSSIEKVLSADIVVLPGVGAFADAMNALNRLDLIGPLKDVVASGGTVVGICLGMQLLMSESFEFGNHRGLGLIEGSVVRFESDRQASGNRLKVPQVGWNRIRRPAVPGAEDPWKTSGLTGVADGEFMYFVHSFHVTPQRSEVVLATTSYGDTEFCSSLQQGTVFGCQFHPERSGTEGLRIYRNIMNIAMTRKRPHG
jgi:glutamine amidotransferase